VFTNVWRIRNFFTHVCGCVGVAHTFAYFGSLFAYEPVLRGLQSMTQVPFEEEIVHGLSRLSPGYGVDIDAPEEMRRQIDKLDESQENALGTALNRRVALIQGPPGTGKTYIGVILARMILHSTEETILCVCYTNHALDAFLEDLLDAGITNIVRMGGASKSQRLAEYNLHEKCKTKAKWTRDQNKRYAQLKGAIEEAERDISTLGRKVAMAIGPKWWRTVSEHLEDTNYEHLEQLRVDEREGEADYLWKRWLKGESPGKIFAGRSNQSLWRMRKDERVCLKHKWQSEIHEPYRTRLADAMKAIESAKSEIKGLESMKDALVLRQTRVIGCTTTKAAMCKDLLDDVAAGVVLVEEAAEIMEAHVLTSVSAKCKHLIMIGDHKQLRPKAEYYPLSVESERGFDLNISLFERLASKIPIATLSVQHRMHPEISAIPKLTTYPNLIDANDVKDITNNPPVKGVLSRVVFVDHKHEEDGQSGADGEGVSKTNAHEVKMVVKTVRYMIQQGYMPKDLVVLTPYLGQLLKLQEALAADDNKVLVGDLDFYEARNKLEGVAGFDVTKMGGGGKPAVDESSDTSVRVATM